MTVRVASPRFLRRLSSRVAWALFALCALSVAGLALMVGLAPDPTSQREVFLRLAVSVLAYPAVGALIVSRQRRHPVGWTLIAIGICFELAALGPAYTEFARLPQYRTLPDPGLVAALTRNLGLAGAGSLLFLFLLFPDGRYLSSRWRWFGTLCIVYSTGLVLVGSVVPGPIPQAPGLVNPLGVPALAPLAPLVAGAGVLLVPFGLLAIAAAVLRFRRSSGVERQQLKWVTAALVALGVVVLPLRLIASTPLRALDPTGSVGPVPGAFGGIPFGVAYALVALAIGVAIFRYRLYDIDLLINRTIVYGAVSAILLVVYAAAVIVSQAALRPFISGSELSVAGSTLLVVALFQPLRRRIQDTVDRRFYRARYDASRTLDAFGLKLRDEVDLEAVRGDLVEAVRRTVQPAHTSVWLRERAR